MSGPRISFGERNGEDIAAATQAQITANSDRAERRMAAVHTAAMKTVVSGYKDRLRADIVAGGFYSAVKLSKTWRGLTFPTSKDSMEPAGYLFTKAATIIDAFTLGVTVRVRNAQYLAIPEGPAKAIVRRLNQASARTRDANGQFADEAGTVARVAAALGVDRLEAHVDERAGRGVLVAAGAKLTRQGRRAARASGPDTVLFALVKQANLPKRIQGRQLLARFDETAFGDFEAAVQAQLDGSER